MRKPKGFKYKVPGPDDLRPNASSADHSRGALAYVPVGVRMIQDFGAGQGKAPAEGQGGTATRKRKPLPPGDGDNIVPGVDR